MNRLGGVVRRTTGYRDKKLAAQLAAVFDAAFYRRANPDVARSGADPLAHFLEVGWAEGRDPCAVFDTDWYLDCNPDVAAAGLNPLAHYLASGGQEGRAPHPLFHGRWYLDQYTDVRSAGANPLHHYLIHGWKEGRRPNALFDPNWYARVHALADGAEPLSHYIETGAAAGLKPAGFFDGAWYLKANPDVAKAGENPLAHYLARGAAEGRAPAPPANEAAATRSFADARPSHPATASGALFDQLFAAACAPSADYAPLKAEAPPAGLKAKLVAFYLPQFHPIPENDAWWGKGFTEWTNVTKAVPQFEGHYQPRLPGELGFYDLRVPEVMARQVALARLHGVSAFCFHTYWFTGRKRLLERPVNDFLARPELDIEFCLCWANENWSRRWDGGEHDLLMEQKHLPQDDREFIEDMAPALRDPRYLKIAGRPILIVYRANILPDPRRTVRVWRDYARANGLGDLYLVAAQSFGLVDPRPFGFDAAVEFPPHHVDRRDLTNKISIINPNYEGIALDFTYLIEQAEASSWPEFDQFRTVAPSWDNEARKPGRGNSYLGGTPSSYSRWLRHAVDTTAAHYPNPDKRLVFINAWNEWAEGAHLEPCRKYGYAFLAETRKAVETGAAPAEPRVSPSLKNAPKHDAFVRRYGRLDDAQWLDTLVASATQRSIDGVALPDYPPVAIQTGMHGATSTEHGLREAFHFYQFIKRHLAKQHMRIDQITLLDYGSGWGRMNRPFLKDVPTDRIYAFEPDPKFFEIARTLNPFINQLTGGFKPEGALPSDTFDLVFGWSIFSHLSEASALDWLVELARSLKPGGLMLQTTWGLRFLNRLEIEAGELKSGRKIDWYSELCLKAMEFDIEGTRRRYNSGEFVWLRSTPKDDYGETFLSAAALKRLIESNGVPLELIAYDDHDLAQDCFVVRRYQHREKGASAARNPRPQSIIRFGSTLNEREEPSVGIDSSLNTRAQGLKHSEFSEGVSTSTKAIVERVPPRATVDLAQIASAALSSQQAKAPLRVDKRHMLETTMPVDRPEFDLDVYLARAAHPKDYDLRAKLEAWREDGVVIFEGAVDQGDIDAFLADLDYVRRNPSRLDIEVEVRGQRWRLPDLAPETLDVTGVKYNCLESVSLAARRLSLNRFVTDFLGHVFQEAPVALQSLTFPKGSNQPAHTDYPYVRTQTKLSHLAASWTPLEDIHPDAGPLAYYPGSHKPGVIEPFDWGGGSVVLEPDSKRLVSEFAPHLHAEMKRAGLAPRVFLPKRGDVLIWHGWLVHEGTQVRDTRRTRLSYVTHYTSLSAYARDRLCPNVIENKRYTALNGGFVFDYPWVADPRALPSWARDA